MNFQLSKMVQSGRFLKPLNHALRPISGIVRLAGDVLKNLNCAKLDKEVPKLLLKLKT